MKDASSGLYLVLSLMVFFAALGKLLSSNEHHKYDIMWMAISLPAIVFFVIKCIKFHKVNRNDQQ